MSIIDILTLVVALGLLGGTALAAVLVHREVRAREAEFDAGGRALPSSAWSRFQADFDAMTDAEVDAEADLAAARVLEDEEWLEAVAIWSAAGRPRTGPEPEDDDDQA